MAHSLLSVKDASVKFGKRTALEGITFSLDPGEVLGIVGRTGAGKTVLLNLLGGVHPPSNGTIRFDGSPVSLPNPHQAQKLGIELVYQKPLLVEWGNVLQNIFFDREVFLFRPSWFPIVYLSDWGGMNRTARRLLARFNLPPDLLNKQVSTLSDEVRLVVALCHALCRPMRLLLLDASLDSLSFQRQQILLEIIRELAQQNVGVIVSSDNLNDLFMVTDRILVLYEGRLTNDRRTSETTPREIVEQIIGTTRQEQVTPIIWALESYYLAEKQTEELRRAQTTLQESLEAKDSLNRQLIGRLQAQVKALNQLNLALQAAHRRLDVEREEERKSLARELHDQVIQDLLSFNYRLEEAGAKSESENQQSELAELRDGIRGVVGDLRQLCGDLRPPTIDTHGLPAAISSFAHEWAERNHISLHLEIDPNLGRFPEGIELSVFRIVQEGLNNIRKHAAAKNAFLQVQRTPTASLLLHLSDDGQGSTKPLDLASLSAHKHFGLVGVSERVALLGGSMQIVPPPGGGFALQVEIPNPYPSYNN
ncbi:MAG: ATP-binding cassette domain-containing protein [Anaerolineales bacterium]|nr:ATP-binding cassette domain-containing protein [Anaerolineales bacterium]